MSTIGKMKANNAFTLIEILLVIVILGIVLAIAAPNFSNGYSRLQLNKTADDLLSVSRWAQAMAIGQERIYALSFSADRRSYGLMRMKVDEGIDDPDSFEAVRGTLGRIHKLPDTIRLVMTQTNAIKGTGYNDQIEFYPDGTIDPAEIQVADSKQKIILSTSVMRGMMIKVSDE